MSDELERGERTVPDHPNASDYDAPTLRRSRDWPQARDAIPPGLELALLPLAFALAAADVFTATWLRRRG